MKSQVGREASSKVRSEVRSKIKGEVQRCATYALCWLAALAASVSPVRCAGLASRTGFYQWDGVAPANTSTDLLTAAREYATATGAKVFRLYIGPRFDYRNHPG